MLKKPLQVTLWSAKGFSAWPLCHIYDKFFDFQSFFGAATVDLWQTRPPKWRPHHWHAANTAAELYLSKSRQGLGLGGLASRGGPVFNDGELTTIALWDCIFTILALLYSAFCCGLILTTINCCQNYPFRSADLVKGFAHTDATTFREKDINTDDVIVRLTHRPNRYHYYRWHTLRLNFSKFFFHFN